MSTDQQRQASLAARKAARAVVAGDVEAELAEMKRNYVGACGTIAAMHEAATGVRGSGPKRGVVEDVEDLRTAYLVLVGLCKTAYALIDMGKADVGPDSDLTQEWRQTRTEWLRAWRANEAS